jgi:hypothetical protein
MVKARAVEGTGSLQQRFSLADTSE